MDADPAADAVVVVPPAGSRPSSARSVRDVLGDVLAGRPDAAGRWAAAVPTGFDLLDRVLDGGLRSTDLVMLGGAPGVGKTIAALQMARRAALAGHHTIYLSYEHDRSTMLGRLLTLELGELGRTADAPTVDRLRGVVLDGTAGFRDLDEAIGSEPLLQEVVERIDAYADQLALVRGSGSATDLAAVERLLDETSRRGTEVLIVDYLQKVAVHPEPADESAKVTRVAEGLKDLALRRGVVVVALVAADLDGMRAERVRLHHLRGSSALAYECDVAILLNDKHRAVARSHLAYDPVRAADFEHQVVFSIEKNRGGPSMVDLEFRKDFMHYRFETRGGFLAERLADDRLAGG